MSLRRRVARDLGVISAKIQGGFAWQITVTDPDGFTSADPLTGFSQDIALAIDPETGVLVTGRLASVSIPIAALKAAGYASLPRGVADNATMPWLVQFDDLEGESYQFKVSESRPDRTFGNIVLILENFK